MTALFNRYSKEEHADAFAAYLSDDDNFEAKGMDGKKLRQLLLGMGLRAKSAEDFLETIWEELDPSSTTALIEEWESAVGIPDD
jgi:uncharacterized protein YmfQ (DUF2313 family)